MPNLVLPDAFPFPTMSTVLAERDGMYDGGDAHYAAVALSALHNIEAALGDAPPPARILDLPCGHGRVTRILRARFPEAAITVCDLDADGVQFAAAQFRARPVASVHDFRTLDLGERYDLIWVGSLVTHFSAEQTRSFLDAMARHLTPHGVLVVTTHGPSIIPRLEQWGYGLPPEDSRAVLEEFRQHGYGYRDYPGGTGYGISLTSEDWLRDALEGGKLRLDGYTVRAWDDHQDVAVMRLRDSRTGREGGRLRRLIGRLRRRVPRG